MFRNCLEKRRGRMPAETPPGKAASRALNQRDKLAARLDREELHPGNKRAHRALADVVAGRKLRLYYKSPAGGGLYIVFGDRNSETQRP
jgi:hypothetical protein